jgi:hypothetical protein
MRSITITPVKGEPQTYKGTDVLTITVETDYGKFRIDTTTTGGGHLCIIGLNANLLVIPRASNVVDIAEGAEGLL